MKIKTDITIITLSLILFFSSCSTLTKLDTTNNSLSLETSTKLSPLYFALERDYNPSLENSDNATILSILGYKTKSEIDRFSKSSTLSVDQENITFVINAEEINITDVINLLNTDSFKNNPIIKIKDGSLSLNINVDNYMALAPIVPILTNETFKAYSAEYNRETTREEFIKLISYVVSEECARELENSIITIKYQDRSTSFSILDFLLLHEPIVL